MEEKLLIQRHSVNDADPHGTERRLAMLQRNRELAEHFVVQSPSKDVCVLIFDVSDGDFPHADGAWIQKVVEEGAIPASVIGMSRWKAYKAMQVYQRALHRQNLGDPKTSPVVERLASPAPSGQFYLMVISKGKQVVSLPIPM
jgi:hypothetical protein